MKGTTRNSSIELLKVIGIFLIILSSATPYGGTFGGQSLSFVDLNRTVISATQVIYLFFRWCG